MQSERAAAGSTCAGSGGINHNILALIRKLVDAEHWVR